MTLEYKKPITMDEALDIDMQIFSAIRGYRLQSLGQLAIDAIVDRLNLEPFYEFLTSFNESNDLPYHNLYHSTCVFLNCYEGAWCLDRDDEEIRGLCAGALLHDFNHSGGHLVDSENIKIALRGLMLAQAYAKGKLLGLSPRSLLIAEEVIKVTQYPFIHEPKTIPEMIIRDSDLMQPYEETPEILLKQYIGLKEEIEVQKKTTFTRSAFAAGVKKFQDSETVWHTDWAIEKAKVRSWEMIKVDLVKLISISEQ